MRVAAQDVEFVVGRVGDTDPSVEDLNEGAFTGDGDGFKVAQEVTNASFDVLLREIFIGRRAGGSDTPIRFEIGIVLRHCSYRVVL